MAIVDVWIGLVGVAALPGGTALGDAAGAYVLALAMASSGEQYEGVVKNALTELRLFAFEFEDVEIFAQRAERFQLDEKLHEIADEVRKSGEVRSGISTATQIWTARSQVEVPGLSGDNPPEFSNP